MSQIPAEFLCPISQSIMDDPVSLSCGHTFNRNNVTLWLMKKSSCPTCRKNIDDNLYTNWALKSLIEKFNNFDINFESTSLENLASDDSINEIEIDKSILSLIKANVSSNNGYVDLCLEIPSFEKRRPVTFVCVIDISGSMAAVVGNSEGGKAFTRLDLVKHVLNVMITSLNESDQLALITFSDQVALELDLLSMNSQNKILAKQIVHQLTPLRTTLTGPALQKAYKLIEKAAKNNLKSVILLTDGQDTEGSEMLEKKFDHIKKPDDVQLNTFGFSNEIVSLCLDRLALKGKGIFGFIPDQSMIGTIFINFMSNTFLTLIQNLKITLENDHEFVLDKNGTKITTVQSGKQHHFLINLKKNTNLDNFKIKLSTLDTEVEFKCDHIKSNRQNFDLQQCRYTMLSILTDPSFTKLDFRKLYPKFVLDEFLAEIKQSDISDPNSEQIYLSSKYWNSWGQHYVRSFKFAHIFEQAINFKSPSMKSYRTEKFDQLIETLTEIFVTLPPPKPSGDAVHDSPQIINMTNIMDRNNGCILSSCTIKLKNGQNKTVDQLKKGDVLNNDAKIVCLVKSKYEGNLIRINNLIITPYHPVYFEGKWQFPFEIYLKKQLNNQNNLAHSIFLVENSKPISVCNLVLDTKHYANVEGLNCITLGHGYKQNRVLNHSFYGSKKCIDALVGLEGWTDGLIDMENFDVVRDSSGNVTNLVNIKTN